MQKLAEICIQRPIFASMIVLALVVVGAASYFRLGVDRFPSVDLPTVSVRTACPGRRRRRSRLRSRNASRKRSTPIEGINELRSISNPGSSFVIVTFNLDRDIEAAAQDVRDRVATVLRDLPAGRRPACHL